MFAKMETCPELWNYTQLFATLSIFWTFLTAWWLLNTWYWNSRNSKPLQKIMSLILGFKTLHLAFTSILFAICLKGPSLPYWTMAMSSTYTLYNTFVFVTFILIGKGFSITRQLADRSELIVVTMTMCAIYLGFSAYMADPGGLSLLMLVMLSLLYYMTSVCTQRSITQIKHQLLWLASSEIPEMIRPARQKLKMMSTFSALMSLFFISQILINLIVSYGLPFIFEVQSGFYMWADAAEESLELMCLAWIFIVFRSKYHGQYFSIAVFDIPSESRARIPLVHASTACKLEETQLESPIVFIAPSSGLIVGVACKGLVRRQ